MQLALMGRGDRGLGKVENAIALGLLLIIISL
jgi:hypothetical protein